MAPAAPEMIVDTLPLYRQLPDPPKVIVAWGDQHAIDNHQTVRMGDVPNVTLEPLRGVAHHPLPVHLIVRPEFDLVKRLLAIWEMALTMSRQPFVRGRPSQAAAGAGRWPPTRRRWRRLHRVVRPADTAGA